MQNARKTTTTSQLIMNMMKMKKINIYKLTAALATILVATSVAHADNMLNILSAYTHEQNALINVKCATDEKSERTGNAAIAFDVTTAKMPISKSSVYWGWRYTYLNNKVSKVFLGNFGKGKDGSDYYNHVAEQKIRRGMLWFRFTPHRLYLEIRSEQGNTIKLYGDYKSHDVDSSTPNRKIRYYAYFLDQAGSKYLAKCTLVNL